jgi:hypothetical protein
MTPQNDTIFIFEGGFDNVLTVRSVEGQGGRCPRHEGIEVSVSEEKAVDSYNETRRRAQRPML